jgi:hypothetical protein
MRFLDFSNHGKGSPACSTTLLKLAVDGLQHVSTSGWGVIRSASLAKGGTSKKRPSPHLHKVPTRSNNELFKRPSYIQGTEYVVMQCKKLGNNKFISAIN